MEEPSKKNLKMKLKNFNVMKIRELDKKYKNQIIVFREFFNKNFNDTNEDDLSVITEDDNSLWIEWIFKNYRYGFIIEENTDESSFYFVSNKEYDNLSISGMLNDNLIADLIKIINKKIRK